MSEIQVDDEGTSPKDRTVARWKLEIERYDRKADKFKRRGKKINARYTAEYKDDDSSSQVRYNILWSNMQTLLPALYGRDPKPEVERRFLDADPVGRAASEVIERVLAYLIPKGLGDAMRQTVQARLLPGRGVTWVRYEPHFQTVPNGPSEPTPQAPQTATTGEGAQVSDEAPEDLELITWELVKFDFVSFLDFGHIVARTWEEVSAVWRIVYLNRDEMERRFGKEKTAEAPYDAKVEGLPENTEGVSELKKCKVYEIWDKKRKEILWLNTTMLEPLDVKEDILDLDDFWPCPSPLQATCSSESYIPTADYTQWSDQAAELDRLTQRISSLTRALKAVGVYDGSVPALRNLLNSGVENQLIAVDAWAAFAEKGGMNGAVELLDIEAVSKIVVNLYECRDKVKQDLYEISGLSDLLRGANDPASTATAEQIKANFVSVRLKNMQADVARFARELVNIAGQIVCNKFQLDTIKQMSGVQLLTAAEKQQTQMQVKAMQQWQQMAQQAQQAQQQGQMPQPVPPQPQPPDPAMAKLLQQPTWEDVIALMRNNAARSFRIDIETDSTIIQDERQEQDARVAFGEVMTKLIQGVSEAAQGSKALATAVAETAKFILRSFKVGRQMEVAFDDAMDALVAEAGQPKADPNVAKIQGQLQLEDKKQQGDMAIEKFKASLEAQTAQQVETFRARSQAWLAEQQQAAQQRQEEQSARVEMAQHAAEMQQDQRMKQMEALMQQHADQQKAQMDLLIARMNNAAKIEVAEIAAQTTLDAAEISAANAASGED